MSVLNSYFHKIYCINLDRRFDRWQHCLREFSLHDLTVERVPAVDGAQLTSAKIKPAELGCVLSHRSVLQRIVDNKIPTALILEDDVQFDTHINDKFAASISQVPLWEVLYLGGNHVKPPKKVNTFFSKNVRTFTTSSYAVTLESAKKLLSLINSYTQIDVVYAKAQPAMKSYSFTPPLAWQVPGFSDIQGDHTDYDVMR